MRQILIIITRKDDPLTAEMLRLQSRQPDCAVEVADLTVPEVDYEALLEQIFNADSVQVWGTPADAFKSSKPN